MTVRDATEADVERVRMCLAEAGYPEADVALEPHDVRGGCLAVGVAFAPDLVILAAFKTAGVLVRCEPCWWTERACLASDHAPGCTGEGWDR